MIFRIPLLTKVLGAGAVGLVLAAGSAAGAGPAVSAVLSAGHPAVAATAATQATAARAKRLGLRARRLVIRSEAAVLHLTPRQLRQDVRAGPSVEELAAKAGMDKSQFTAAVVADLRAKLDNLVKAGKLKQTQADAIIDRVQKGWLPLWTLKPRPAAPSTAAPSA